MKKRTSASLRLDTQTIRPLAGAQLEHAAGGSVLVLQTLGLSCGAPSVAGTDSTTTQPVSIFRPSR